MRKYLATALFALDGVINNFVVIARASPTFKSFTIEDGFESGVAFACKMLVGFIRRKFLDENILPTDFATMSLQLNCTLIKKWQLAIEIIFEDGVIYNKLVVEVNSSTSAYLDDAELVPFAKRLVSKNEGIFAWGSWGVIPEAARTLVCTNLEFFFIEKIPDLNLGSVLEVDTAIALGQHFVFKMKFIICEFFFGGKIKALTIVNDFIAFNFPMSQNILHVGFFELGLFSGWKCFELAWIGSTKSPPITKIFAIEEVDKPSRRSGRTCGCSFFRFILGSFFFYIRLRSFFFRLWFNFRLRGFFFYFRLGCFFLRLWLYFRLRSFFFYFGLGCFFLRLWLLSR